MNGLRFLLAFVLAFLCMLPQACLAALPSTVNDVIYMEDSSMFSDLNIPTYTWTVTEATPKAIVVALHGGCLHGRNYEHLGRLLAEQGFMLVSTDMFGYGKYHYENYGGEYGKTFHYERSIANVVAIVERLRDSYPDTPIFGLGESLGGNAAMRVAAEQHHLLDGIIIISGYARMKLFFHPRMVAHALQIITRPTSKLNVIPYLNRRLSEKPEWAREQTSDPLARDRQTVVELIKSLYFNKRACHSALQIPADTPVLFIHGAKDRLCTPKHTLGLYKKLNIADKQFELLPGRGHLLVETAHIHPEVMQIILTWIGKHKHTSP